jgi:hypothetical protein
MYLLDLSSVLMATTLRLLLVSAPAVARVHVTVLLMSALLLASMLLLQ